jgi:tRNA-2-methylthio-N6-dimethylallyladenosine synthase
MQAVHFQYDGDPGAGHRDPHVSDGDLKGHIVDVRVIDASLNSLTGELIKVREAAL